MESGITGKVFLPSVRLSCSTEPILIRNRRKSIKNGWKSTPEQKRSPDRKQQICGQPWLIISGMKRQL
jgi:hypothetical protein